MGSLFELTLGILTALGGFVDIGELVFATQAGAKFGLHLLWTIPIGAAAIAVYAEMCGRVATVTKKPVFPLITEKFGYSVGISTLVASKVANVLTCAAEVGGVAIILRLLTGISYGLGIAVAFLLLLGVVWVLPFSKIEKVFGMMGLFMLVFLASAIAVGPNWASVAQSLVPHVPQFNDTSDLAVYLYFAVGLIAATVMPYEVYFYASGTIEDGRKPEELPINAITAIFGFGFGSLVTVALIVLGAAVFLPNGIVPEQLGTSAIGPFVTFGQIGLLMALLGMLFAVGGAAIETNFASAYNLTQFFGWEWGKHLPPQRVVRFTLSWIAIFAVAVVILVSGIDPVQLTEYAVIFSLLVLPLTYLPILLVARDRKYMGDHVNTRIVSAIGWFFFAVLTAISIVAVPLMYVTHQGQG